MQELTHTATKSDPILCLHRIDFYVRAARRIARSMLKHLLKYQILTEYTYFFHQQSKKFYF